MGDMASCPLLNCFEQISRDFVSKLIENMCFATSITTVGAICTFDMVSELDSEVFPVERRM